MINWLGEAMMMTWAKMGLKIENQIITQESLTFLHIRSRVQLRKKCT